MRPEQLRNYPSLRAGLSNDSLCKITRSYYMSENCPITSCGHLVKRLQRLFKQFPESDMNTKYANSVYGP